MINSDFWGVYSPKGELEAVCDSEGLAREAALDLSPQVGGKRPQVANRTVERVDVVRGSFWQMLDQANVAPLVQNAIDNFHWLEQEQRRLNGEAIARRMQEEKAKQ
jgi:hypothetical protein